MNVLLEWLLEQSHLTAFLQVFLDLLLITFFVIVIARRSRGAEEGGELGQSLQKILTDTQAIAQEFDANLKERSEIINHVVATLDSKINEARQVQQDLEKLKRQIEYSASSKTFSSRDHENQAILHLARKGLDAAAIAERLQKPLGEVEMVLSLRRLTTGR